MLEEFFQAPPKEIPKTIENMRVHDETMVSPDDEEVCVSTKCYIKQIVYFKLYIE